MRYEHTNIQIQHVTPGSHAYAEALKLLRYATDDEAAELETPRISGRQKHRTNVPHAQD